MFHAPVSPASATCLVYFKRLAPGYCALRVECCVTSYDQESFLDSPREGHRIRYANHHSKDHVISKKVITRFSYC